ncbi:MAG TPA: hypothetical protein PKX27_08295 [Bacteroidales bacterium]|jgi:hypothetical protein|nr:hypothetical protein [Bacteroidales bacterium]HPM87968.1 hypothetical protein [Bacteroidales bacterium]HQM70218.1 hypothetical protein [Bacteroidales bacterium]
MAIKKDILIPKEILNGLQNSVRIIDKRHLAGYWPVEFRQLKQLQKVLPEIIGNEALANKFDLAIGYKMKPERNDLAKSGLQVIADRIVPDIWLVGIPIPWILLRRAEIDHRKFEIVLTPKGLM